MEPLNLYLHFPFCKAKCRYCDFFTLTGKEQLFAQYCQRLQQEFLEQESLWKNRHITTIYLGGGTPSLLPAEMIRQVMEVVLSQVQLDTNVEITMEANPESLQAEKLKIYKEIGINRLSIGLQAWQDSLLFAMGRIHKAETFVKGFTTARSVGFENINVDLMFGLPKQTIEQWQETLSQVVALQPNHISAYSLELDNHSFWGKQAQAKQLLPTPDILDREMYHYAQEFLTDKGYNQYELSNYALPGFECQHNLRFWHGQDYLGFGASAWSRVDGLRWENVESIENYIGESLPIHKEKLSLLQLRQEQFLLQLRLAQGINLKEFDETFQTSYQQELADTINQLVEQGLLSQNHSVIQLTSLGQDLERQVGVAFMDSFITKATS